jgi:hypothetical protein
VHGDLREDAMALDHMHEARLRGAARPDAAHVLAGEAHPALEPRQQARDGAQQRGFPRAVGAEQHHDLAGRDVQVHASCSTTILP